jgi:hypothetical protein
VRHAHPDRENVGLVRRRDRELLDAYENTIHGMRSLLERLLRKQNKELFAAVSIQGSRAEPRHEECS